MVSFKEFKNPPKIENVKIYDLDEDGLKEIQALEEKLNKILQAEGIAGVDRAINEGLLGSIAGFLVGPAIGKVIARALGIEKGILYDMFTSRLVSAALGSAIQNNSGKK